MAEISIGNENWKKARKLLNLVTSAIDCILRDRYDGYTREPFHVELGDEAGTGASHTSEEIEKMLDLVLSKPEPFPPEAGVVFSALKKEHTDERLAEFLKLIVNKPLVAELALLELKEASWEDVLIWIDSYIAEPSYLQRKVGELVVERREGFGSPKTREIESSVGMRSPNFFSLDVVRKCAAEFRELLPDMIERAQCLQIIPALRNVPPHLELYLSEASRCFIYGHFLASLLVCRSAIEAATKGRLKSSGYKRELSEVEDSLKSILDLALEKGLIDSVVCEAAQDIRRLANKAAHPEAAPDERLCRKAFDATRGILQHLYE